MKHTVSTIVCDSSPAYRVVVLDENDRAVFVTEWQGRESDALTLANAFIDQYIDEHERLLRGIARRINKMRREAVDPLDCIPTDGLLRDGEYAEHYRNKLGGIQSRILQLSNGIQEVYRLNRADLIDVRLIVKQKQEARNNAEEVLKNMK